MQHSHCFFDVLFDPVNNYKRERGEYQFTRALDSAWTAALRKRFERGDAIVDRTRYAVGDERILDAYILDDSREVNGGFRRPTNAHEDGISRTEDALHPQAHFLVRNRLALVQRRESFRNLLPEPFIMFEMTGDKFLHYLVRALASL